MNPEPPARPTDHAIEYIRQQLRAAEADGRSTVDIATFLRALDALEAELGSEGSAVARARFVELEARWRGYIDGEKWFRERRETYNKWAIEAGTNTVPIPPEIKG